jgi:hypothetical protein
MPFSITVTGPVVAVLGTTPTICVLLQLVNNVADTPLKRSELLPCVAPKLDPVTVTDAPNPPDVGVMPVITGVGAVTKLIAEIEKFTGDDHSWSSGVSTGSGATGPSTVSDSKSYQQQIGEILDQLADKTPRQLGNDAVGDVQFPGRDSWEQRLFDQKLKFIAAGRHLQAVYASGIQGAINPADLDYRIQANVYNEIRAEGIGKAADWARKAQ